MHGDTAFDLTGDVFDAAEREITLSASEKEKNIWDASESRAR